MWFIKSKHWEEFQEAVKSIEEEIKAKKKVIVIRTLEEFCKEGKGVSFYNRFIISNKLVKEMEIYINDDDYKAVEIKDLEKSLL
ncbi:hypothetical protein HYG86_05750 [Alkalicella caledoniensis]|uniref:Uncharacterized protein n=1 Tax=Alkalicella caledoniensis TaxID=2731377 RepID=A0A7G9W6J9_ALKCA|nr:hypothetical protein [Alkalicella caledoniensis]QNO14311.1 hypothetical protein HYG86_05750 [Alkalicella caledoniensis]